GVWRQVAGGWARAFSLHVHRDRGARSRTLGGGVPGRASVAGSGCPGVGGRDGGGLFWLRGVRFDPPCQARPAALMADRGQHSHPTTSHKVLVAVGGQEVDAETVRLACRMTDPQGGRLYGVHIIEVNRSLPLGAVLDDVVESGEMILDEVEKISAESQLTGGTTDVWARDAGLALVA